MQKKFEQLCKEILAKYAPHIDPDARAGIATWCSVMIHKDISERVPSLFWHIPEDGPELMDKLTDLLDTYVDYDPLDLCTDMANACQNHFLAQINELLK